MMDFEMMYKKAETIHSMVIAMTVALDCAEESGRTATDYAPAMHEIDNQLADLTEAMMVALAEHNRVEGGLKGHGANKVADTE